MNVQSINSYLRLGVERGDPKKLAANGGLSFQGSVVLGMGFTLTPDERDDLIKRNKKNAERIFPYIGGKEVNTSPTQAFHRYVINFSDMSLAEAGSWPDLLDIVRENVKPERDRLKNNADGRRRKEYWWQFGRETPALYAALEGLPQCLVSSVVTKHLVFAFLPTQYVCSSNLHVFTNSSTGFFAVMQSRVHGVWVHGSSSTLEQRLKYVLSSCFDTFPFPNPSRGPLDKP
jgi:hypothetical protein